MAKDRMFFRCVCGATICLAKHDGKAWYPQPVIAGDNLQIRLQDWFITHEKCDDGKRPAYPRLFFESQEYVNPLRDLSEYGYYN